LLCATAANACSKLALAAASRNLIQSNMVDRWICDRLNGVDSPVSGSMERSWHMQRDRLQHGW